MKNQPEEKRSYRKVNVEKYISEYMSACDTDSLFMDYGQDCHLNEFQEHLYNRVIYGLDIYDHKEVRKMHPAKRKRIVEKHYKTRKVLNDWRLDIIYSLSNSLFSLFKQHTVVEEQGVGKLHLRPLIDTEASPCRSDIKDAMSLAELGITRGQVIDKLIKSRILPDNFYELGDSVNQNSTYHESNNSN